MKKVISLMLVILMLFGLCSCGLEDIPTFNNFIRTINGDSLEGADQEYSADRIKIGVLEPLTGQFAAAAEAEIEGIKLAKSVFSTVLGKQVELVYADNQSDTTVAVEAAQSLIDQGCKIIIGSYGNLLSLAACDTIEAAEIPMIIPSCSNPLLTTTTDFCFRVCIVEAFQGNSAAKYIIEHLPSVLHLTSEDDPDTEEDESLETPKVNCYILKKSTDEKASAQIERFQAKMESVFGSDGYVRVIEYPEGTSDFSPYLEKLSNLKAQAVFFPSTAADAEPVLYQAKELGYTFRWVGNSDWASLFDAAASAGREDTKYLNNVVYVAAYDNEAEVGNNVAIIYSNTVQAYFTDGEPSENVALGFDAYMIAIEGLKQAGLEASGDKLRETINNIREMSAATGSITYNGGTGDPVKDVVIEKIMNGEVSVDYIAAPKFDEE